MQRLFGNGSIPTRKFRFAAFGDPEFVFVRFDAPASDKPFNPDDVITSGIEEVLFPFPGAISPDPDNNDVKFTTLVETSNHSGLISFEDLQANMQMNRGRSRDVPNEAGTRHWEIYAGRPHLKGRKRLRKKRTRAMARAIQRTSPKRMTQNPLTSFLSLISICCPRSLLQSGSNLIKTCVFAFENVMTFILNVMDSLAGETDYMETRKRKTHYSTLKAIEQFADYARQDELKEQKKFEDDYTIAIRASRKSQ